jgi:hypothetical protein
MEDYLIIKMVHCIIHLLKIEVLMERKKLPEEIGGEFLYNPRKNKRKEVSFLVM